MSNDKKTMTTTNIDELLAKSGVQSIAAAPPTPPADVVPPPEDGTYIGTVRAGDGRWLHKYADSNSRDGYLILPKKLDEMTEEDFYGLSLAFSDAASNRIPQNLTVKFKDPQWAGYWFNRKASDGKSVSRALALGFVGAKREDCEWVAQNLNDTDGAITDGDLVLMKIHKMKYFRTFIGSYFAEAKAKGGQERYKQEAEGMVGARGAGKVSHYLTPQAEKEMHGLGPVTHIPTVS